MSSDGRSDDRMSTQLNLNRSLKLLDAASGSAASPFRHSLLSSPLSSTTRRSGAATPTLFRGDQTLSFISAPTQRRTTHDTGDHDQTALLLGEKTFTPSSFDTTQDVNTTNVTLLLKEENANLEGTEIYEEFSEIFQSNGGPHQIFDMLSSYAVALGVKTDISKSLLRNTTTSKKRLAGLVQLHENLRTEMWTWQLASSLLRDLVQSELATEEDEMMDDTDPHTVTTDNQLMEQFFSQNDKVRRSQIIIDWLETINSEDVLDSFYDKVDFFTGKTSTMWENTLHLKKIVSRKGQSLVQELDPDAPHRTGERLSALDEEDDERMLRYMFALLRAGKLDEAQQLCVRCGQAWRAATLEGWRLSHDPNYTSDEAEQQATVGNPFRDVWKSACWSMAKEETYSTYERAIYASMSGNLEQLLPVCDSWPDALWAHLKVLVDVELEQHLRLHSSSNDHQIVELPAAYWARATNLRQVFKELEASHKDTVREQCQQFFHKIQKYLIQNDFEALVGVMIDTYTGSTLSPHILRFMAHFVLFLRNFDKVAMEGSSCEIVEEYIKYLVHSKQYSLVATYCAVLPKESQLITYALFLEGVSARNDRALVLAQGKKAGLDMFTISRIVTENCLFKLKDMVDVNPGGEEMLTPHQEPQVDIIVDSLDWLLFDPEQVMDAIHQCNAQMRIFLAIKQYDRLKQVFSKLSSDCISRAMSGKEEMELMDDSNAIKEYICFKTYLDAHQAFDDWFQHLHQAPHKPANTAGRHFAENVALEQRMKQYEQDYKRWENALKASTEHTTDQLKAVLLFAGGWMEDMAESETEDQSLLTRQEQLLRLRQLCIPETVSLLHKVLVETKQRDECRLLLDTIQSEDYQLYKTFPPNDLKRIVTSLEESAKQ